MTTEQTGETVNVAPQFNYHAHVEIVKRFMEQVTRLEALDRADPDRDNFEPLLDYIRVNIQHAREATREILADDIERQIKITSDFPVKTSLRLHAFRDAYDGDETRGKPWCNYGGCRFHDDPDAMVHTL